MHDANVLYKSGSYSSAVVLTSFAREELGRYLILLDLRRRAFAGESFLMAQIKSACDDHLIKQRAGMLSSTIRTDKDSEIGKILQARMTNDPQSKEWQKADAALNMVDEIKKKRTPSDRHEKRLAALYVEPISETEWNRPVVTSASETRDFLIDAANEYSIQHERYSGSILKDTDPELYETLQGWSDRPKLQLPEWPKYP